VPGVVALAGAVVVFGVWHAIEEGAPEGGDE